MNKPRHTYKLIVGPGQGCIFIYEGKIQSVLEHECMIDLTTANIPLSGPQSKNLCSFLKVSIKSAFILKKNKILDQKWGTTSAIKYDDPKYKFPVGLKAYGNYSYRIDDTRSFFVNGVGSHNEFYIDDFRTVMSARIIHPISDYLAESKSSYAEIDANREEIARGISIKLSMAFRKLGFDITDFRIEGTDFDADTLKRINRIADLTAEPQAANAVGLDYAKIKPLEAMREAARNEGGGAGIGKGQNMAQAMNQQNSPTETTDTYNAMQKTRQIKKNV